MNSENVMSRLDLAVLALGVFFGFYFLIGSVPLFDLDEGAFSEATREMLVSGNYLTTYLDGELRFDKPILIYWFQALSVKIFGLGEFAFRLPSAIAATLWVMVLYLFTIRFYERSVAVMAAFMMATALQVSIIAKAAIADSLLNLFIALSMFTIYLYYEKREKRYLYAIFLFIGLGALTKGPVAVLVPLAVSLIFLVMKGEWKFWLKTVFNPIGIAIFLAVAAPWYILEYMDQGEKFINGFFFKHNMNRFNTSLEGHGGSLFYFIPVLLVGTLPYTSLLLRSLRDVRSWFGSDLLRFLAVWFLFVFIFFSLSGTKLPHYIIYGYTPLFIIMAIHIDKVRSDILLLLPLVMLYVVLLFLPEIAGLAEPHVRDDFARAVMKDAAQEFQLSWYLFFIFAIALLGWLMVTNMLTRVKKLIITGLLSVIGINGFVMPTYAAIAQAPIKEAALLAKERGYDVHMWRLNMPSFVVYSGKLTNKSQPGVGSIVVSKVTRLEAFEEHEVLYEKHGIVLAKILKMKEERE